MTHYIPVSGLALCLHVFGIPVSHHETRLLMYNARDFARSLPLGPLIAWFSGRVGLEDQKVVESSFPVEVPLPGEERSLPYDGPTLKFRQYSYEHLRGVRGTWVREEGALAEAPL